MKLKDYIARALELTHRLQLALDQDDLALAQSTLEERAVALRGFQDAHRAATPEEKDSCLPELRALQSADQDLMSHILDARDALARDIHKAGMAHPGFHSPYLDDSKQACVNRKA